MITDNERWNNMLSNLQATTHELHSVNIKQLLNELRHCGARVIQDSGQRYTYVSMEDIHGALENVIANAKVTQDSPKVIFDSSDFVQVIENDLHGLAEAKALKIKSLGCTTIKTSTVYMPCHVLDECIRLYEEASTQV